MCAISKKWQSRNTEEHETLLVAKLSSKAGVLWRWPKFIKKLGHNNCSSKKNIIGIPYKNIWNMNFFPTPEGHGSLCMVPFKWLDLLKRGPTNHHWGCSRTAIKCMTTQPGKANDCRVWFQAPKPKLRHFAATCLPMTWNDEEYWSLRKHDCKNGILKWNFSTTPPPQIPF